MKTRTSPASSRKLGCSQLLERPQLHIIREAPADDDDAASDGVGETDDDATSSDDYGRATHVGARDGGAAFGGSDADCAVVVTTSDESSDEAREGMREDIRGDRISSPMGNAAHDEASACGPRKPPRPWPPVRLIPAIPDGSSALAIV